MLPMLRERKTAVFGLVAGRHPLPVDKYIWTEEVQNPMDHKALYDHASNVIGTEWDEIIVYVTGLTPLSPCRRGSLPLGRDHPQGYAV